MKQRQILDQSLIFTSYKVNNVRKGKFFFYFTQDVNESSYYAMRAVHFKEKYN